MQEIFWKIIEKLEDKRKTAEQLIMENPQDELDRIQTQTAEDFASAYNDAIKIVKQEAEQYNNGWIPCNERMPEEHDSMFARFKGTDKWRDSMFEKTSNEVAVIIADDKGDKATTHAHTSDGTWKCDILRACPTYRVIAWQPLPAPYQPNGE